MADSGRQGARAVESPEFEDDSVGFDAVERDHLRDRGIVPDFEWLAVDHPSPRILPRKPLQAARVGLVTTAGAHLPDQKPVGPGGGVRLIPIDAEDVVLTHPGYDTERAQTDLDVVYPVPTLRRLANSRAIGSVAPTIVSTMGFVPDGRRVLERTIPPARDALLAEQVDLALLVPA
jgi:hypothetical protein